MALGILRACYVSWLLPGLECNWCLRHQLHSNPKEVRLNGFVTSRLETAF
jgi:hypothetical protein